MRPIAAAWIAILLLTSSCHLLLSHGGAPGDAGAGEGAGPTADGHTDAAVGADADGAPPQPPGLIINYRSIGARSKPLLEQVGHATIDADGLLSAGRDVSGRMMNTSGSTSPPDSAVSTSTKFTSEAGI